MCVILYNFLTYLSAEYDFINFKRSTSVKLGLKIRSPQQPVCHSQPWEKCTQCITIDRRAYGEYSYLSYYTGSCLQCSVHNQRNQRQLEYTASLLTCKGLITAWYMNGCLMRYWVTLTRECIVYNWQWLWNDTMNAAGRTAVPIYTMGELQTLKTNIKHAKTELEFDIFFWIPTLWYLFNIPKSKKLAQFFSTINWCKFT